MDLGASQLVSRRNRRPWRPWAPRVVEFEPPEQGTTDGLAWARFAAPRPLGGLLVLAGAGSQKESHFAFCREARAAGLTALCFDARGHGASDGALGGGAVDDLATMAGLLPRPLALRGSSMGGYLALVGASAVGARAVVSICPASSDMLLRGLRAGRFDFRADRTALEAFLTTHDDVDAARELDAALLLMHAEGDDSVPVEHSRRLAEVAPRARLLAIPGGHHSSVQHDAELQGESLRWLAKALAGRA